jgi:1,4-dihydroxy-6-naphthoate synthase
MFWALASGRVSLPGIEFEHILRDIETLNQWALEGRLEITAISAHALAYVAGRYSVLRHGASMGDGYGPMLVTRKPAVASDLSGATVAVPGELTTACLAFQLWWRDACAGLDPPLLAIVPFDMIMDAVLGGSVSAGLIIHEGQLTYGDAGFHAVVDLGVWWKSRRGLPLPLGLNAIRSDLPQDVQSSVSAALRASISEGLSHRGEALAHALTYARGVPEQTADRFVGMYVNDWTLDMGPKGQEAVALLLTEAAAAGLTPPVGHVRFVE